MLRVYRRFTVIPSVLASCLLSGVWMPLAIAQVPPPAPQLRAHFTPYTLQRLSRDLNTPSPSEDFFRVGQEQFEQEIQRWRNPRSRFTGDILKVSPTIQQSQDSFPAGSPGKEVNGSDIPAS